MRQQSKILTASEQKTADTLATTKAELKIAQAGLKELTKTAKTAETLRAKAAAGVTKLEDRIAKLAPAKPVIVAATPITKGVGVAQAA